MKVNIKGFGELEFPDGTSQEQIKISINKAIADGTLKPQEETQEVVEPQGEYTPPELQYNLDDPQELAQAISQKEGIPYQEAYERVAVNPRTARARFSGSYFPIVSRVADEVTRPFRALAGVSASLAGEDPMERMAQPVRGDENAYTGFLGNMANDPFSYTPGVVSKGFGKLGGTAISNAPKWISGAKEGVVAGLGEYGLGEYQKEEEGIETNNNLGTGLLQSAIGGVAGGAFGKYADKQATKQSLEEMPTVLRGKDEASDNIEIDYSGQGKDEVLDGAESFNVASPVKHRERILLDVQKGTGFSKAQAESLPEYARKQFANIDDEGKQALNNYMAQAETSASDLQAPTPYDFVGRMFVRGKDAIQQAKQQAGATMGDIEKQYLSGAQVKNHSPKYETIVETTDSRSGEIFQNIKATDENGEVVGILNFSEFNGKPIIKMVESFKKRKGVATDLYNKLQELYPDKYIETSGFTDDGAKVRAVLENKGVLNKKQDAYKGLISFGKNKVEEQKSLEKELSEAIKNENFESVDIIEDRLAKVGQSIREINRKLGEDVSKIKTNEGFNGAISTAKMKENWSKLLEEHGGLINKDGELVPSTKRAPVIGDFYKEFADADNLINSMGDYVTGEYLRSIEKNLSQLTKVAGASRNGVMNSEADMAVNKMIKESRDLVGEQIKANGGEDALDAYNQAKKDYGKYWTAEDFIDRRLGKNIVAGEGDEFATRGASMVQGMMRNEDRNSKALARMIQGLTGEDIGKHAVFAKFAMQSAKDKRGGGGWSPNWSKSGLMEKIGTWGYNKLNPYKQIPQDFEGMSSMVSGATPVDKQTPSILEQAGQNPYISSIGETFKGFFQPKILRSGGRSQFSGEQESNKVTEKPLGGIGAEKIRQGMGQ